jgi:uncharacterized membrane protein YdfJ with MMPL/SSD domain
VLTPAGCTISRFLRWEGIPALSRVRLQGRGRSGFDAAPNPTPGRGMFARLGRVVVTHPGKVFVVWMLAVAALIGVSAALGQPAPSRSEATQLPSSKESAQAQRVLDAAFGAPSADATSTLVISRQDGQQLTTAEVAAANHAVAGLTAREAHRRDDAHRGQKPAVVHVGPSVQLSPNRLVALAGVSFKGESNSPGTSLAVDHLRKDVRDALANTGYVCG